MRDKLKNQEKSFTMYELDPTLKTNEIQYL